MTATYSSRSRRCPRPGRDSMCWKSGHVGQTSDLRECAIRGAKTALPVVGVSLRRAPESDIASDRVVVDDVEGAA